MKKRSLFSVASILTLVLFSAAAQANPDDIRLGLPTYSGSGCPGGSASATVSPDGKEISVLFDRFTAETTLGQQRRACNLSIPVHIPQGYSVSILSVDYRGFVSVGMIGQASLRADYYFGGSKGVSFRRTFEPGTVDNYLFTNNLQVTNMVWSKCGADTELNTQASIEAIGPGGAEMTSITVDSMDAKAGITYRLSWRKCDQGTAPPPPPPPIDDLGNLTTITGVIDGVDLAGDRAIIRGWACAISSARSIDVHLYVGGPAGQGGVGVGSYRADRPSEDAVEARCQSGANAHRFAIELSPQQTKQYAGKAVFVHGISPFGETNLLIDNSGQFTVPAPLNMDLFPEGLFQVGGGVAYSNGVNAFCTFVSWHHFNAVTGRNDVAGLPRYPEFPRGMANHGACQIQHLREGLFISQGGVYYSNGNDAFCVFSSPDHLHRHGIWSLEGVLEYPAPPTQMRNDGVCGG